MGKIMNFADGPKEIHVGMKVAYSNGQMGRHYRVSQSEVEKVGTKLVTLKNGDKFFLETGSKQTDYTSGKLFSSIEIMEKITKENKYIDLVKFKLREWSLKLDYNQALEIAKLLNFEIQE